MKKDKKYLIIAIVLTVVLTIGITLLLCFLFVNDKDKGLIEINYSELVEKLDNKDTFILITSQTSCSACLQYKPKIKEIALEYKIKVYYIEVNKMSDEDFKTMKKDLSYDSGTPTTFFFKDGVEESAAYRILGNAKKDTVINKFKNFGFIK